MLAFLAQEKDPNLIKVLLKHGVDPNMIVKKEDDEFPIFLLSMYQVTDASLIQAMITAGADVNKGMMGNAIPFTPLMAAALMTTNPEIITVLLDAGADPNAKLLGVSALDFARENESLEGSVALERLEQATLQKEK